MGAPYEQYKGTEGFEMVCLSCGKHLESSLPKECGGYIPSGGLLFQSSGNYGSTIFDPMDTKERLQLFVCDDCIMEKKQQLLYVHEYNHKVLKYERWAAEPHYKALGQKQVDDLFESLDLEPLFNSLLSECPRKSEDMAAFVKKFFLQKMVDGEFPLQDVLNVQVHLGPTENLIQLRIAIDEGVAFFHHAG